MGRNAETELLDDIVDLFAPFDNMVKTSDIADGISRDVVALVKDRLVSPDEMDLIQDTMQEAYEAIEVAASASVAAQTALHELAKLLPEKMRLS